MEMILLALIFLSFLLTMIFIPKWISKCRQIGLLWEDMNKYGHPNNVASSGGIVIVMAFFISSLIYLITLSGENEIVSKILAMLCVIAILSIIGLADDFLGWKRGGLSWRFRLILAFAASIPIVAISTGNYTILLPFLGNVQLGWIYPFVLIPIGIAGATTTYNFLAGFNSLEAGQGIIILSSFSLIAYLTGSSWLAVIGLIMVASLAAFYFYNKVPASVFPGNIMTWAVGAMIACMAILGNFEKIAVFIFIPYIIETILKVGRGRMKKYSFGIPNKDNSLEMPYGKIYGLTHFAIFALKKFKKKVYEQDVAYFIHAIQIIIIAIALIIFKSSIFG